MKHFLQYILFFYLLVRFGAFRSERFSDPAGHPSPNAPMGLRELAVAAGEHEGIYSLVIYLKRSEKLEILR